MRRDRDERRLRHRSDQVLAGGEIDRGLAADRGVDRGEQGGRDRDERDAALIGRRGETDRVADRAAADADDDAATVELGLDEVRVQIAERSERLERFVGRHRKERRVDASIVVGARDARAEGFDGVVDDDDRAAAGRRRDPLGQRFDHARADRDVVRPERRNVHDAFVPQLGVDRVGRRVRRETVDGDAHRGVEIARPPLGVQALERSRLAQQRPRPGVPRGVGGAHFERGVEEHQDPALRDGAPVGAVFERAAAERDDGVAARRDARDRLAFERAERGLAVLVDDPRDLPAGVGLDQRVDVDGVDAAQRGEQRRDARLARAGEPAEVDVTGHEPSSPRRARARRVRRASRRRTSRAPLPPRPARAAIHR